jgi:hypothetical protein
VIVNPLPLAWPVLALALANGCRFFTTTPAGSDADVGFC